ncbi:glyoxalase [Actinospongicola halichondriae]|uniref:glyoxalase n=1 Tax=Actinospongicola halichondriae TaxID=3236844 RepID=UPI003D572DC6
MTAIRHVTLEASDAREANEFYTSVFGFGRELHVRGSDAPTTGFRGFTLSADVSGPASVDAFIGTALHAGAVPVKPPKKQIWGGYSGVIQVPDGSIWKVGTNIKKGGGPATPAIERIVLLLGVADVALSKKFYTDRGLAVAKSFGSKYVEFNPGSGPVTLGLYRRRGLAKEFGVSPDGTGARRLAIGCDAQPFTDPDGFTWERTFVHED